MTAYLHAESVLQSLERDLLGAIEIHHHAGVRHAASA